MRIRIVGQVEEGDYSRGGASEAQERGFRRIVRRELRAHGLVGIVTLQGRPRINLRGERFNEYLLSGRGYSGKGGRRLFAHLPHLAKRLERWGIAAGWTYGSMSTAL